MSAERPVSQRLVTPKEAWAAEKPTDLMTWAVCPYLRDLSDCAQCPESEVDGHEGRVTRGCRVMAEEACRIVEAARQKGRAA